jgi:hypothetical protein
MLAEYVAVNYFSNISSAMKVSAVTVQLWVYAVATFIASMWITIITFFN